MSEGSGCTWDLQYIRVLWSMLELLKHMELCWGLEEPNEFLKWKPTTLDLSLICMWTYLVVSYKNIRSLCGGRGGKWRQINGLLWGRYEYYNSTNDAISKCCGVCRSFSCEHMCAHKLTQIWERERERESLVVSYGNIQSDRQAYGEIAHKTQIGRHTMLAIQWAPPSI